MATMFPELMEKVALLASTKASAASKAMQKAKLLGYGRRHGPAEGAAIQRRVLQHAKFKGWESPQRTRPMHGGPGSQPRASASEAKKIEISTGSR